MALIHRFCVVETNNKELFDNSSFYCDLIQNNIISDCKIIDKINLHDDLFGYFEDMLLWIPTYTPKCISNPSSCGLNRYGVTVLDKNSYRAMSELLEGLIKIFSIAPDKFSLKGNYTISPNETLGTYDEIFLCKDEFIDMLLKFSSLLKNISIDNCFMVHLGI